MKNTRLDETPSKTIQERSAAGPVKGLHLIAVAQALRLNAHPSRDRDCLAVRATKSGTKFANAWLYDKMQLKVRWL